MTLSLDFPHTACPHLRTAYRRPGEGARTTWLPHSMKSNAPRWSY